MPRHRSPSRSAYIPSGPPHSPSNIGCTLAMTPSRPKSATASTEGISQCSSRCRAPPQRVVAEQPGGRVEALGHGVEGGVTDAVEAGLDPEPGAADDVLGDLGGVEVAVAAVVRAASAYSPRIEAVREPTAPSATRSPARPDTPSSATRSKAPSSPQ